MGIMSSIYMVLSEVEVGQIEMCKHFDSFCCMLERVSLSL